LLRREFNGQLAKTAGDEKSANRRIPNVRLLRRLEGDGVLLIGVQRSDDNCRAWTLSPQYA
jgi:hypothetical protein